MADTSDVGALVPTRRFTLEYDGPALREGRMDARDAATVILGAARLVERSSDVLFPGEKQVTLEVDAHFREGSFDIDFTIASRVGEVLSILSDLDLKTLVTVLLGEGGLIWAYLKLKGKKPEEVKQEGDSYTWKVEGESVTVDARVYNLAVDKETLAGLKDIVSPLRRPGIDRARVADPVDGEEQYIEKPERVYLEKPVEQTERREVRSHLFVAEVTEVDFKEGHKWEFREGEASYYASIDDDHFMARVQERSERFGAGDVLEGVMEVEATFRDGRLADVERRILHVARHRRPSDHAQLSLLESSTQPEPDTETEGGRPPPSDE